MAAKATKKAKSKPSLPPTPSSVLRGELNINQELFCRYYTQNTSDFGNATWAYAHAYDYRLEELADDDEVWGTRDGQDGKPERYLISASSRSKAYNVCAVEGNRLLRTPKVLERITTLLNEQLTEKVVDAELLKVIRQDHDLGPKVRAISEFNKLRARVTERLDLTSKGKTIAHLITVAHAQPDGGADTPAAV